MQVLEETLLAIRADIASFCAEIMAHLLTYPGKSKEIGLLVLHPLPETPSRKASTHTSDGEASHEDLVDVLLRLQEEGNLEIPLSMTDIKCTILDMFIDGIDTSSTTLVWTMSELLKNPRVMKKALRVYPSIPLLVLRESKERCEIDGYEIPAKTQVIVNVRAISINPENWSDPERFLQERFIYSSIDYKGNHFQYLTFGARRRICPSISFRIAKVELALANLLYHFDWKLLEGQKLEDLDMDEVFGATVNKKRDLCVIPIAYHPSAGE
ncbi:desmethyl-deoxy-podophyllotoxin synthase-like [Cornus florida]|uniref:desmethyl-deoxy-podophyllotoxin synthase-like n=1 Tax=Cornus florida TaxID=4283 RepID=UPI00289B6FFA|nr:desmethyl-deoxy-podophyllotoxin synthase-like [Cornus florida]